MQFHIAGFGLEWNLEWIEDSCHDPPHMEKKYIVVVQ